MSPVFSPDGARVAFLTRAAGHTPYSLFVANADGSGARSVTGDMQVNSPPWGGLTWSPDGTKLALESSDNGVWRIYVVGADGTGLHPITDATADRRTPNWSPDGSLILYQLTPRDGGEFLAVINPDGTGERRILPGRTGRCVVQGIAVDERSSHRLLPLGGRHPHRGDRQLDGHERLLSRPYEDSVNPQVSPDDRRVAFGMASGSAIVDIDDPSRRVEIPDRAG